MVRITSISVGWWFACSLIAAVWAQEPPRAPQDVAKQAEEALRTNVAQVAQEVNRNERAHEASAEILKPIYRFAEYLSFPAFHWAAFAVMVTGVVSFALQLVLAKLVVLSRMSFSLTEVFSDALGLVISAVGLVLTTQAATENSSFTRSPAAVLSATAVGVLAGLVFYWWGQRQEVLAIEGRRKPNA